ncbi:MAG: nicotinate (nicotinamide) nucleotide adenylyltransferase [Pseudomonadota bacterium]
MSYQRPAAFLPPSRTRARIGLFGGSFDPPHSGHLHVAATAMKRLGLNQVWWFPTPGNPLKEAPSDYTARFEAVEDLTQHHRRFRVSDVEKQLNLRYTIDLVRLLRERCPHAQLVWIMGGDSLMTFHYWKDWRALADLVPIAVVARPGFELSARISPFSKILKRQRLPDTAAHILPGRSTPSWVYLTAPLDPISSSALRQTQ